MEDHVNMGHAELRWYSPLSSQNSPGKCRKYIQENNKFFSSKTHIFQEKKYKNWENSAKIKCLDDRNINFCELFIEEH